MKESIRALKLDLKAIAQKIRNNKKLRKKAHPHHEKYCGDYELMKLRDNFRHKHVAYCLARGRTLDKIDSGYKLDMARVEWTIKAMAEDSKEKLYVVVNQELSTSQQAVQSAHAVAEFMRKNPHTLWRNGYLILLKDRPWANGNMRCYHNGEYAEFIEPDVGNKVTAYALFGVSAEQAMKSKALL